jgi:hypothetical protein
MPRNDEGFWRAFQSNFGTQIAVALGLMYVILKVLSVAKWDQTTAVAIIQTAGILPVIAGVVIGALGQLVGIALLFAAVAALAIRGSGPLIWLLFGLLLVLAAFVTPVFGLIVVLIVISRVSGLCGGVRVAEQDVWE